MNEAQRYAFVGRLIEEQPNDVDEHSVLRWIGRATAVAKEIDLASAAELAAISSMTHIAGTLKTAGQHRLDAFRAKLVRCLDNATRAGAIGP